MQFTNIRKNLYEVNLDIPIDYENLISDFETESWIANENGYGQKEFISRYQLDWKNIKSNNVLLLQNYFNGPGFHEVLLDLCYKDPGFPMNWGVSPKVMSRITKSFAVFNKDLPGFSTQRHLDNRMLVASGMVYFIDGDRADQSTTFFESFESQEPTRVSTGYGKGWVALNDYNTWHIGGNYSQDVRYSVVLGLMIHDNI